MTSRDRSPEAPRLAPLEAPFAAEVEERLAAMMGGVDRPPLALFRTLVHNMTMTRAMAGWGAHTLGPSSSLDTRTREIVIWRVCVRTGCEYEWGVHVAVFGPSASLGAAHAQGSISGGTHPVWTAQERLVIAMVDELHDTSSVSDGLWRELEVLWSKEQLLDAVMLAGWYHAIAYVANAARLPLEPWAARFGDTEAR